MLHVISHEQRSSGCEMGTSRSPFRPQSWCWCVRLEQDDLARPAFTISSSEEMLLPQMNLRRYFLAASPIRASETDNDDDDLSDAT